MRYDFAVTQARAINLHSILLVALCCPSQLQMQGVSRLRLVLALAVGLTLLRARQGERLTFAFANASAKRDIGRAIAHPLVP